MKFVDLCHLICQKMSWQATPNSAGDWEDNVIMRDNVDDDGGDNDADDDDEDDEDGDDDGGGGGDGDGGGEDGDDDDDDAEDEVEDEKVDDDDVEKGEDDDVEEEGRSKTGTILRILLCTTSFFPGGSVRFLKNTIFQNLADSG